MVGFLLVSTGFSTWVITLGERAAGGDPVQRRCSPCIENFAEKWVKPY
jgi:hypothetical protein